jgi:hypothetical protein
MKNHHDIKASNLVKILDDFPEMALQNRRHLLRNKFDLIRKEQPQRKTPYIRNLFMRHPDLFMTSYASMEAKASYLKRNLNRPIHKEGAFPLLLLYSYTDVVWPRCELLVASGERAFNLAEVLSCSDEEFCGKFGFAVETLDAKKRERKQIEEKDRMWNYVPAI